MTLAFQIDCGDPREGAVNSRPKEEARWTTLAVSSSNTRHRDARGLGWPLSCRGAGAQLNAADPAGSWKGDHTRRSDVLPFDLHRSKRTGRIERAALNLRRSETRQWRWEETPALLSSGSAKKPPSHDWEVWCTGGCWSPVEKQHYFPSRLIPLPSLNSQQRLRTGAANRV